MPGGHEQSAACANVHPSCVDWAETGECETNQQFMHASCRLACGLCDHEVAGANEHAFANMDPTSIGVGVVVILATLGWLLFRRRRETVQVPSNHLRTQRLRHFSGAKAAAPPAAPARSLLGCA